MVFIVPADPICTIQRSFCTKIIHYVLALLVLWGPRFARHSERRIGYGVFFQVWKIYVYTEYRTYIFTVPALTDSLLRSAPTHNPFQDPSADYS